MTKAFRDLASGTLAPPQTWEVLVSREGNKKEIWEGLIKSNQIGYLALLRNLRNMEQAGVDRELIEKHLLSLRAPRIFPYQFVAAWRAAPSFEKVLSKVMLRTIRQYESFFATTAVLVDVSGSMEAPMSFRGNLTRMDAAASIALFGFGHHRPEFSYLFRIGSSRQN
jgi:60 kDa SS-A/Ro ribonucleoprotein